MTYICLKLHLLLTNNYKNNKMIRWNNLPAKAMEFTSFRKKQNVTDDELLFAITKFEKALSTLDGLIFHCLVRNFSDEYANVLFATEIENLKQLESNLRKNEDVANFFKLIDMGTTKVEFHEILQDNFEIPSSFSCIEKGLFSLKDFNDSALLQEISSEIECNYLTTFSNTKAHFVGKIDSNAFSEITFGETLGATKQICMGYFDNESCKNLLNRIDEKTMHLDFWYLIA